MKCSACYADNALWATVCVMCGQPVHAIELCPSGHVLPPGSRECAVCPSTWPETTSFTGPPILRGVVVAERGRLVDATGADLPFIELRDSEAPMTLAEAGPDRLQMIDSNSMAGDARFLVRPDGLRICLKSGGRAGRMAYEPVDAGSPIAIGGVQLRPVSFEVPAGVGGK